MLMGDSRRAYCKCCGRHRDEAGELSWNGLCVTCWPAIVNENAHGISEQRGWPHERRLRGIERYLERSRVDAAQMAS